MSLKLPEVTLMAIDCLAPGNTVLAMQQAMRLVRFGRMVLLTDTVRHQLIEPKPATLGIEVFHTEQSDNKIRPYPNAPLVCPDANMDELVKPADYCETDYQLYMEWDSCVLNPLAWDDTWLEYDFIGAPWVDHCDPGWPPCDEHNNVGNFGFSLRSRRFCKMIKDAVTEHWTNPDIRRQMTICDSFACRTMRPWLEQGGIRFAPEDVAARFSCENRVYSGAFGYHGRLTAKLNGWGNWMELVNR